MLPRQAARYCALIIPAKIPLRRAELDRAEAPDIGCSSIGYRTLLPLVHEPVGLIDRASAPVSTGHGARRPLQAATKVLQNILQSVSEDSLEGARDRALLALRIAGAFRTLELAKLSVEQIRRDGDRLEISLGGWGSRRSARRNLLTVLDDAVVQPVALMDIWLARSDVRSGRLFRQVRRNRATEAPMTEHHVAEAIQNRAFAAGYDWIVLSDIKARRPSVGLKPV
jgi:hypothetical protein